MIIGAFALGYFIAKQDCSSCIQEVKQLREEIKELNELYQNVLEENRILKEEIPKLLIQSYSNKVIWDITGLGQYRRGLCLLKIYLKDEIPIIGQLPC